MEYASVDRTKAEAQSWYDRLAPWYDRLIHPFERRAIRRCLDVAAIDRGESVLEIGSGTGHTLLELADATGDTGRAIGIDFAAEMVALTDVKLGRANVPAGAVMQADATALPFGDDVYDVLVMTFTLELFPTDELVTVLEEASRVLRDDGRLVILSLYRRGRMAAVYEAVHNRFPRAFDCRPLPLPDVLIAQHWRVHGTRTGTIGGIPYIIADARQVQ